MALQQMAVSGTIWIVLFVVEYVELILQISLQLFFCLYILLWLKYLEETFLKKKKFVIGIIPIHILVVCEMGFDFAL